MTKKNPFFLNMLNCKRVQLRPKSAASFAKLYITFIDAEQTISDAKPTLCTELMLGGVQNVSG